MIKTGCLLTAFYIYQDGEVFAVEWRADEKLG